MNNCALFWLAGEQEREEGLGDGSMKVSKVKDLKSKMT